MTVATTRPETLFGDLAVAVHPEDERYTHLIGKHAILPISKRPIPIIADEYVDREFGTGCVKITPSHDFNDFEVGQRHQLGSFNIMNPNGTLNDSVPAEFQGLTMKAARKKVIEALEAAQQLVETNKHSMQVPIGDRSGTIIEPFLTKQWFVHAKPLAERALKAAQKNDITFHPQNWINTYSRWLEDIQDWCISRQLWWGHRIPAWYDDQGNIYVGHDEADVRERFQLAPSLSLTQDEDVLDTWFSSALWPFSTLGWPEKSPDIDTFYPTSCLVTGFDIIFFWVARMVMMGLECLDDVPFKDIYITGLIRDFKGDKMSKSKGNVIDPIDIIDGISLEDLVQKRTSHLMQPDLADKIAKATRKEFPKGIDAFGTDALRFTFCAMATTGRDVKFDTQRLAGYSNFCNKIWNSARFVMMLEEKVSPKDHQIELDISQWMKSKLIQLEEVQDDCMSKYRFDLLCQAIHHGFWHHFCDWYLELVKASMDLLSDQEKSQLIYDTKSILVQLLKIMHPVIPFITDEIYTFLQNEQQSILDQNFVRTSAAISQTPIQNVETICQWVSEIRTVRSELNIPPSAMVQTSGLDQLQTNHQPLFLKMTKLCPNNDNKSDNSIACDIAGKRIHLDIGEHIDINKETDRLERQIVKKSKELSKIQSKVGNQDYLARAPQDLIEKDQSRIMELNEEITKLKQIFNTLNP